MARLKWTIGITNWDSLEFIQYHAKYFHEFCSDFEFIVYDNENIQGTASFDDIRKKYNRTRIVQTPSVSPGCHGHGLGLNACVQMAKGKYILLMDPDFFWMKKDILSFFESYFKMGYHAIGTEYWGNTFPMPWGAAYITDEIRDLNLMAKSSFCEKYGTWVYDRDYDTGWQIRIRLGNKPHQAFRQVLNQVPDLGRYNTGYSQTYVYDTKVIAHHLKGGSQIEGSYTEEQILEIRGKYTEWMWSQLYD
jgi:glycosyltransferase involved in cell wall biosynthesis